MTELTSLTYRRVGRTNRLIDRSIEIVESDRKPHRIAIDKTFYHRVSGSWTVEIRFLASRSKIERNSFKPVFVIDVHLQGIAWDAVSRLPANVAAIST